jgi:hypothetical protein
MAGSSDTAAGLLGLEEQDSTVAEVKVDEVFCLCKRVSRDEATVLQ